MKRVNKPLDVGGLRLYQVRMTFAQHPEWNDVHIVAAHTPRETRDPVAARAEQIYMRREGEVEYADCVTEAEMELSEEANEAESEAK